jgi:hypothetical protein
MKANVYMLIKKFYKYFHGVGPHNAPIYEPMGHCMLIIAYEYQHVHLYINIHI